MLLSLALAFVEGFVATFLTLAPGLAAAPNLKDGRAAIVACIVGGLTAGAKAIRKALQSRRIVPPTRQVA